MNTTLNARELGTVLAALRYWQRTCESDYAIADCAEPNEDRDEEDEDAEDHAWRESGEAERMAADDYVSAALSAWR